MTRPKIMVFLEPLFSEAEPGVLVFSQDRCGDWNRYGRFFSFIYFVLLRFLSLRERLGQKVLGRYPARTCWGGRCLSSLMKAWPGERQMCQH